MQASARLSSSAAFKKVIAGVSSATTRSCYRTSRGKAHAAPLPAQEPPPKGRKRITIQERRALIVEFVDNYRASNEGKFPTITNTRDQIGGSYYTVRKVLQEMEYNAKAAPRQGTIEVSKPEPRNQQREIKVKELELKIPEKSPDANVSNASDENEAKRHAREDNPKLEESVNTGLFGSLKSFAYGIRNFWKNI